MTARPAAMPRREAAGIVASETWAPQDRQANYLKSLTHLGTQVHLPSGASLFSQGLVDDAFYVVQAGKLNVHTLSEEGDEVTLNIMGPGSVIGEAAAFLQQPRFSAARAIEDSVLLRFEVARIPELVRQDPEFAVALLHVLSVKQRQMVERLRQRVFDSPERRVLRFFQQFRQTHRDAHQPDLAVQVNLTQEQIGNLTDLSRVTVARVLNKFKRQGRVAIQGKRLLLLPGFDGLAIEEPDGKARDGMSDGSPPR